MGGDDLIRVDYYDPSGLVISDELEPCPAGRECALNRLGSCEACGRNWPPDETWATDA